MMMSECQWSYELLYKYLFIGLTWGYVITEKYDVIYMMKVCYWKVWCDLYDESMLLKDVMWSVWWKYVTEKYGVSYMKEVEQCIN